ncbi:UNVERIFIED_CONTAM: hypothetical protein FKN15_040955 [Acipenser sinensis]
MATDGGSSVFVSPCAFSPKSHQYLALSTQDGSLRVWDTQSNTLYQEYVPSAHLSATCTCLAWGPCRTFKDGPQRKKRKSEVAQHGGQLDLLALGTAAGTVLLYSTVKGQLHSKLDGGHDSKVNCVRWHPENNSLYSCSDDSHIVEWDLQTGRVKCKWKADKCAVSCLCLSPDGKMLLSAGQTIKMWDLETKEVYRTLNAGETHVCLVRDIQASLTLRTETTVTKVKTPTVKADAKLLVPGLPGHSASNKSTPLETKRKPGSDTKEMSIEERLGVIDLSPAEGHKGVHKGGLPLQTDSFAVLLVQGLESSDSNILNKVFQTKKEVLIKKTVARLPIPAVLPLVQELSKRMQGHPYSGVLMVRWLKAVFTFHASYLSTLPSLVSQLGVLYHMIESRVKMFHKLSRLHGKLYLLITQIAATDKSHSVAALDQTAKLVYEEDSSEEEEEGTGDEMLAEEEDSDHWEEEEEMKEVTERSDKGEEHSDEEMNMENKLNGESDLEPDNESEEE